MEAEARGSTHKHQSNYRSRIVLKHCNDAAHVLEGHGKHSQSSDNSTAPSRLLSSVRTVGEKSPLHSSSDQWQRSILQAERCAKVSPALIPSQDLIVSAFGMPTPLQNSRKDGAPSAETPSTNSTKGGWATRHKRAVPRGRSSTGR